MLPKCLLTYEFIFAVVIIILDFIYSDTFSVSTNRINKQKRCDEVDLGQWFIHLLNITDYTGKN
jgi:hypothetical protein